MIAENNLVCPGDIWCKIVGEANCHEDALRWEPFYGRGSNGLGGNADEDQRLKTIYHTNVKSAHAVPCDEKGLRNHCYDVLTTECRITDPSWFCDTLECPRLSSFGEKWGLGDIADICVQE